MNLFKDYTTLNLNDMLQVWTLFCIRTIIDVPSF